MEGLRKIRAERWAIVLMMVWAALSCAGCSKVKDKKPFSFALPNVGMNEGAVALQVAVVQLDADQRETFEEFWEQLDTLKLPLSVRRVGDLNGVRYAVMSPQCPVLFEPMLQRRPVDIDRLSDIQKQMAEKGLLESPTRLLIHQRIENDRGEEFEIALSDYLPEAAWEIIDSRGSRETGQGNLVKGVARFSTFPHGDGSVRLVVQPEIHHGSPQQRYGVSQRTFLFSDSQIETKIEPLKFSIDLKAGESIVIAPLQPSPDQDAATQAAEEKSAMRIGDLLFGQHEPIAPAAAPIAQDTDNSPEGKEIEALFAELDQKIENGANGTATDLLNMLDEDIKVQESAPPVKPLCRFLMVRLVHTQENDLFDSASKTEYLTTINHQ